MKKQKKKILLITFFPGDGLIQLQKRGGIRKVQDRLKMYMDSFDEIYLNSFGGEDEKKIKVLPGIRILNNKIRINKFLYFLLFPFIHFRYLKQVSVIEANQMSAGIPGLLLKLIFRKPLIVRCGYDWLEFSKHQNRFFEKIGAKIFTRLLYKFADKFYVTSKRQINQMKKFGVSNNRILYYPNSVDLTLFKPDVEQIKKTGLIVSVGRLVRQKNYISLFNALEKFHHPYELLIFGKGAWVGFLKQTANQLNINVKFMGTIESAALVRYLIESQVFVLPSLWEGSSNALIEAMACGCSIIASDIDANKELLTDGVDGILVNPSSNKIRYALEKVFEDDILRNNISKQARITAVERFDLEKNEKKLICLIKNTVKQ